jgi:hypothetical protein
MTDETPMRGPLCYWEENDELGKHRVRRAHVNLLRDEAGNHALAAAGASGRVRMEHQAREQALDEIADIITQFLV